ncbi:UPF0175 family protein [Thiohalocapsa sp. ML1]|jgi:predicted HTH domain antitoxin|uniref:UPF0175 family protein n=1 Tax=Thiohalocapsa sp. ML1 TaxID=1431688 RepID=UPI0007323D94|nr:UPF0175 family protein [Thiohalocapsa sp. ML1]
MQLTIPDEILIGQSLDEQALLEALAITLYRDGRITLGHGCRITGLSEIAFQRLLAHAGVDLYYPEETLDADLETLRRGIDS